jgi:arylsulfatase A-like enzyme
VPRRTLQEAMKTLAALLFALVASLCTAAEKKPNIVIILADDLGYGYVGYQGGKAKTPNIDKLAAEGVQLKAIYGHPMCSPTRAAMLTGRYASRWGVTGAQNEQAFPFGTPTLASVLQSSGYETALTGKWHLGSAVEMAPNKFGFGYSYGLLAGGATPDTHEYKFGPHQRTWHRNGKFLDEEGHITDLITRDAVKWIGERTDKPFFLYVPFTAVHVPIVEEKRWLDANSHITDPSQHLLAADVTHLDDSVGQIVAALERKGVRENTIVLFLSDNGAPDKVDNKQDKYPGADGREALKITGSNGPLRGFKSSVYEGGVRTPGVASWPAKWKPRALDYPLSMTDWLPTLCKLAGVEVPAEVKQDGRDIAPLLSGAADKMLLKPRSIYSALPGFRGRMVREGTWKLIVLTGKDGKETRELYNVVDDIGESRNLATAQPERVKELEALLTKLAADDKPGKSGAKGD